MSRVTGSRQPRQSHNGTGDGTLGHCCPVGTELTIGHVDQQLDDGLSQLSGDAALQPPELTSGTQATLREAHERRLGHGSRQSALDLD